MYIYYCLYIFFCNSDELIKFIGGEDVETLVPSTPRVAVGRAFRSAAYTCF